MKNRNKIGIGLIAGALIGAIAGLLFAPKPGRDTREMVGARAGELRHRADEWRDRAGDYIGNLKVRSGEARKLRPSKITQRTGYRPTDKSSGLQLVTTLHEVERLPEMMRMTS
jgi:gas vesicle protein